VFYDGEKHGVRPPTQHTPRRVLPEGVRRCRVYVRLVPVVLLVAATACSSAAPGNVRLRVLMADDWAGAGPVLDAVRTFERANPRVTVELEPVQFEFVADVVREAIARGDPPDVVQFHAFAAGATGMAQPVDDLWGGLDPADFLSGPIEDVTWAGVKYGLPLDANAMAILYNADVLGAADAPRLEDPYGFARFAQIARAVTTEDRVGIALPSSTWAAYGWIRANGGEVVESDEQGRPVFTFDRPENVEALAFLGDLVRDGHAEPPIGRLGDRTDAFAMFRAERAAMHATGSWDLAALRRESLAWEVGVAVMPRGVDGRREGGTVLGGSSLFVPVGSDHRVEAFAFMKHLISDPYAGRLAVEEGRLPVRVAVYDEPALRTPALQTFFEQMQRARPFRLEAFPEAHAVFREAVRATLQAEQTAAEALADAQRLVGELDAA